MLKRDQLISDWLEQQQDSTELEQIIALTENLDVPSKRSKSDAWDMLTERINTEAKDNERILVPATPGKKSYQWMYWAAGIAAIFLIGFFGIQNTPKPTSISSGMNSVLAYQLPGGSTVTLGSNSTITFIENNWDEKRELSLIGEAFFDVVEGNDFHVITGAGEVNVLGTTFNVKERDGLFEVSCATGKVAVSSENTEAILLPGEGARLTNNVLEKNAVNVSEIGSWRTGDFFFNQTPLSAVIAELERQFNIEIATSVNTRERIYNGYFNKDNLKEALQLVFIPMGLQFEIEGQQVTVE